MNINEDLRGKRKVWQKNTNQREYQILRKKCETLNSAIADTVNDIEEENAPTEVSLRRDYLHGLIYLLVTGCLILGIMFLVELSIQMFLPQNQFALWKQRTICFIFTSGIVISFHLLLDNRQKGEPIFYMKLIWFTVVCFMSSSFLLSVIRGFLADGTNETIDNLREIERWSRLLGVLALVLMSIGLDIAAGLTGHLAWSQLSRSIPLLRLYKKLRRFRTEKAIMEEKCILTYQISDSWYKSTNGKSADETNVPDYTASSN